MILARKHAAPSRECPTGLHWPWWVQAQAAFLKGDLPQVYDSSNNNNNDNSNGNGNSNSSSIYKTSTTITIVTRTIMIMITITIR